jgi:uncharacterized protein (DUF58 family)
MVRRIELAVIALIVVIGALSTGAQFLFFLVYMGILVVGGSYVVTRFGLADLEAGYVLDRLHAQTGDILRASYTVRNTSRLPKLWLELRNPSTLPIELPAQAVTLGPRSEKSWSVRVPLTRRGHFRVEPVLLRTGDPLGMFESQASVGSASNVIVYPRVEALPGWKLPPAFIEGSHASPVRTPHTTPHATGIRPYAPGDPFNRIHWKSTARTNHLQVKEFDLEQTADVWIFLDLQHSAHTGLDDESTLEYGVRVAASVAARGLLENRNVALSASGAHIGPLPADRGARQYQKIMQTLAAVQADGTQPFSHLLVEGITRLRRGMTALIITPSLESDWVKPLASLRGRGVEVEVMLLDAPAFAAQERRATGRIEPSEEVISSEQRAARALRHVLADRDLRWHTILPMEPISGQLITRRGRQFARAA